MITKEQILKHFIGDELNIATKIYDKYYLAYMRNITITTEEFVTPNIWSYFEKYGRSKEINVTTNGVFTESERRVISFNKIDDYEDSIVIIKIENKSNFAELKHKDYLGAIMSLGITREKIGDIFVDDKQAFIPVINGIENYIIYNMDKIGKSKVEISLVDDFQSIKGPELKEETINLASLRLDCLISKLIKSSRSNSNDCISGGKVLVDYSKVTNKDFVIKEGQRITVRGYGKFIVGNIIGETKSGKLKVIIRKYV